MRAFAKRFCVIVLFAKIVSTASIPEPHPALSTAVRVFKPVQLKNAVLYKGSKSRDGIQCPSASLIHQDIQPTRVRGDVFWVPHSMIIHNGLRCGTGKRNEYMLVINGRDLVKASIAKERGLIEVFNELRTNARGISSYSALNAIDPVHVGIEMSAHRQCGGRVVYPKGSVFLFMSPSLTNINLGFAYFPKFSVGMVSVLNNQNLCAYVDGKSAAFSDPNPSISPIAKLAPPPKDPYALDDPLISPNPTTSPAAEVPLRSRAPVPKSASPSPMASRATVAKPSNSPSRGPLGQPGLKSPEPSPSRSPKAVAASPSASKSSASVSTTSGQGSCFPNSATVEMVSGRIVEISSLRIGDRVRTGANSFSDVFMFTHKEDAGGNEFVRIEVKSHTFVELSEGHYIRTNGGLTAARNVMSGDTIILASGLEDFVVGVKYIAKKGLHNPQTVDGNIVVNGIAVSCYTTAVHPRAAHSLLAPIRGLYAFGLWQTPLNNVFHRSDHGLLSYLPNFFSGLPYSKGALKVMR